MVATSSFEDALVEELEQALKERWAAEDRAHPQGVAWRFIDGKSCTWSKHQHGWKQVDPNAPEIGMCYGDPPIYIYAGEGKPFYKYVPPQEPPAVDAKDVK